MSVTSSTSANGNISFDSLKHGKVAILYIDTNKDIYAIPYFHSPARGVLGAHCEYDNGNKAASVKLTCDVYYIDL